MIFSSKVGKKLEILNVTQYTLKLCHSASVGFHRRELDSPTCYHHYHYIDTVYSVTCAHAVSPTSIFWSVEHRAGILIQETERGSSRECSCPQFFYTDSFSFSISSLSLPLSPHSFLLLYSFSMKKLTFLIFHILYHGQLIPGPSVLI